MSSSRSRTLALLAAGALLLVTLTACGDDEGSSNANPAAAETAEVDKAAFVTGLVDAIKEQKSAQAELTFGTTVTATAAFNYGTAKPQARIAANLFGQKIEVVVVDGEFYLKKSETAKFVRLAEDDPSLSLFGGLSDVDPKKSLTGIADGIKEVRDAGAETVDGQELTRYEVLLDAEALGSGMLAMVPGVDASKDITLDLYVDEDNLVRRAEADLGENDLTLVVTDWGKPVTIEAPPASEVLQN